MWPGTSGGMSIALRAGDGYGWAVGWRTSLRGSGVENWKLLDLHYVSQCWVQVQRGKRPVPEFHVHIWGG